MDVVNTIHTACNELGIVFRYGTQAINNTFNNGIEPGDIVCMLESPINKSEGTNEYGTNSEKKSGSKIILGMSSKLDETIYNENDYNEDEGKYNMHIVPLEAKLELIKEKLNACTQTLSVWSYFEAYNVMDYNIDALIITFEFQHD